MTFPIILRDQKNQPEYAIVSIDINQAAFLQKILQKNNIHFIVNCDFEKIKSLFYDYKKDVFVFSPYQYINVNTFRDFLKVILNKDYKND